MCMRKRQKIMTRLFCVLLVLCALLWSATGCGSGVESYFSFREQDFRAELAGVMGEVAFRATASALRVDGGEGRVMRVSYSEPSYLAGVTVEAFPDGSARISDGEIETESTSQAMAGLLSPVSSLFWGEEIATVQREGGQTVLGFPDGSRLSLSEDGLPVRFYSVKMSYEVQSWSTENGL